MSLSRDDIFGPAPLFIKEWCGSVALSPLSILDRLSVQERMTERREQIAAAIEEGREPPEPLSERVLLAIAAVVDASGNHIFNDDDYETVAQLSDISLGRIARAVADLDRPRSFTDLKASFRRSPERQFAYRLAGHLGMTVGELNEKMSTAEFEEWQAFFAIEPFGTVVTDHYWRTFMTAFYQANFCHANGIKFSDIPEFFDRNPEATAKRKQAEADAELAHFFNSMAAMSKIQSQDLGD